MKDSKKIIVCSTVVLFLLVLVSCNDYSGKWKQEVTFPEINNNYRFFQTPISEKDINQLKQEGFTDPEDELRKDLLKNENLIPYQGILGGTFHFGNQIIILENNLVLASVSDGHLDGKVLFAYQIENKSIKWEVVCAIKNNE